MASTIISRTITSVVDKRISLSNSHFARLHNVGTWTQLRIATRLIVNTGASITSSSPDFFVGVCSGTSAIYGDASATHAVGVHTFAASWVWDTSPQLYLGGAATAIRPRKQVATTFTNGAAMGDARFYPGATADRRTLYFVDITKGSPNYTLKCFFCNLPAGAGGLGGSEASLADFLTQSLAATPAKSGHTFSAGFTIAANESDGVLDCVNLSWNVGSAPIEICELAVVKLA